MKKNSVRHINIPIFIPHLGCPNDCVFCNQRKISGKLNLDLSNSDKEISDYIGSLGKACINGENTDIQIAFFGGSFTGIEREDMLYLLRIAKKYIDKGTVSSIRLSTRPDYISEEILDILKEYGVKNIELGIQSMSDKVLSASKRGHTSKASESACRLIKSYGCFELTAQIMIGLPGSNLEDELFTAREVCRFGADSARIYPTVVLKDTKLAEMAFCGEYVPLTDEEAIYRTSEVLYEFIKRDVPVIRIGLCAQDNLSTDCDIACGTYNESIGECAVSLIYKKLIKEKLDVYDADALRGHFLTVEASHGSTSKIVGHKKAVKENIMTQYGLKSFKVIEKSNIIGYNINVIVK